MEGIRPMRKIDIPTGSHSALDLLPDAFSLAVVSNDLASRLVLINIVCRM